MGGFLGFKGHVGCGPPPPPPLFPFPPRIHAFMHAKARNRPWQKRRTTRSAGKRTRRHGLACCGVKWRRVRGLCPLQHVHVHTHSLPQYKDARESVRAPSYLGVVAREHVSVADVWWACTRATDNLWCSGQLTCVRMRYRLHVGVNVNNLCRPALDHVCQESKVCAEMYAMLLPFLPAH